MTQKSELCRNGIIKAICQKDGNVIHGNVIHKAKLYWIFRSKHYGFPLATIFNVVTQLGGIL